MATDTLVELRGSNRLAGSSTINLAQVSSAPQTNTPESTHRLPGMPTSAGKDDPRGWFPRTLAVDAAATKVNVLQLAVENLSPDVVGRHWRSLDTLSTTP